MLLGRCALQSCRQEITDRVSVVKLSDGRIAHLMCSFELGNDLPPEPFPERRVPRDFWSLP